MDRPPMGRPARIRGEIRQIRRRTLRWIRNWLEETENLVHLVIIFVVPVLLAFVTWLANVTPFISFLVYPPLASGTYTLFADPEGSHSSARRFVGGMTLGALCGWISLELTARFWYAVPPEQFQVHAGATALSIFLTALSTWLLDLEAPTAFSTALLVLVTGAEELIYVAGIAASSTIVAAAFVVWYDRFYEHRAQYLFQTVKSDDRVLVPVRDVAADTETALFAGYLAAAHEAGKVVLYRAITPEDIPGESAFEPEAAGTRSADASVVLDAEPDTAADTDPVPESVMEEMESIETALTETVDVPTEMVVAEADPDDPRAVIETARSVDCDLIVSRYDAGADGEAGSDYAARLFRGDIDSIAFHSIERKTSWSRVLVMVKRPGELAHAMLDFANRLATTANFVSICRCIQSPGERTEAETMLRNLVSSFRAQFETRVSYDDVEDVLRRAGQNYDLVILGASSRRSPASQILTPPTFENIDEVECDVAIVHRG